jgi:hypothetical protein
VDDEAAVRGVERVQDVVDDPEDPMRRERAALRRDDLAEGLPSRRSMTRYQEPPLSSWPTSRTGTMFGCWSALAARPSLMKR